MKKSSTVEQKAYQLKVKEIRSEFKPNPPSPMRHISHVNINPPLELKREPNLMGFVSDYDLQLFREAQAIASEKMEMDLLKLPPERGTKYVKNYEELLLFFVGIHVIIFFFSPRYITMGRHNMEVWYQSPYPDDAARLPKLYLCEFCLRYQKSEITMKRHAAKCVWRHPPGDEVSFWFFFFFRLEKRAFNSFIWIFFLIFSIISSVDLSKGKTWRMASGWQATETILSTFMFAGEILPRPQDPLLWCRALSILRYDISRLWRLSYDRLLQQSECLFSFDRWTGSGPKEQKI